MASRSSAHRRSTSASRSATSRESAERRASDLLLLSQLHAQLPVGVLINDAKTLEILHANPPLPGFAETDLRLDDIIGSRNEQHDPQFAGSELASLLEQVAVTGRPRHLREFRHDLLERGPRWWSASLYRIDTDRWGAVVVTLTVDLTDQVCARYLLEQRDQRRLALQQSISAVPGRNLVSSLQQVADTLRPALPVEVASLRLRDADGKLHLVAAAGFRRPEIRRLTLEPFDERQLETIAGDSSYPRVGSLGLRWVEIRWLRVRDDRIGVLTVGARSERRLRAEDVALLDATAAKLSYGLESVDRSPRFLRSCSRQLARLSADANETPHALVNRLRRRELAILRLYADGFQTRQIAELLVLSPHTVRTHVRNALRRLGVSSRSEAVELLDRTNADPVI